MGYDDQELARYTHPPLSTLVLPNYEMGQKAAEILIDMAIHGKQPRPMTIKVDGPLVRRSTTRETGLDGRFRRNAFISNSISC
ncbi:substrate-binding domain-containing protein [Rhizobium sp. RCAM05350]|nr:substrate-binding domain-containing protein [Rhizobium sp. RCAM05350]